MMNSDWHITWRHVLWGALLVAVVLVCQICFAAVGYSMLVTPHYLNRNLVAWWRGSQGLVGSDTFLDIVNGNDVLMVNMGYSSTSGWSPSTGTGGYWRMNFDGVDDWGTVGNPPQLANIDQKTICLWMTLTSFGASQVGRIWDKQNNGGWYWTLNNTDVPNGMVYTQDFSTTQGSWRWSNVLTLNTRTHACVTYDRTSTANVPVLYINAQQQAAPSVASAPAGTATSDAGSSMRLGDRPANDRAFNGSMEDIRLWNVRLGPKDIERVYTLSLQGDPGLLWTPEMRQIASMPLTVAAPGSLLPFFHPPRTPR